MFGLVIAMPTQVGNNKDMTTTQTITHWTNDNGMVACQNHLGTYGTSELAAKPKARKLQTPIGTWVKMTETDFADWMELMTEFGHSQACEICRSNN
jgi:hypothetical protein